MLPQIFLANSQGSAPKRLLPPKTLAFDPALSPDGKRIAFVGSAHPDRRDRDPALALVVMKLDGSDRIQLVQREERGQYLLAPRWSPDGGRLAFCTMVFLPRGDGGVYSSPPHIEVIDADGQNRHRLEKVEGLNPAWSADGKRLLFTTIAELGAGLSTVDVDGPHVSELVKPVNAAMMAGSWSPDGRWLAYAVTAGGEPVSDKGRITQTLTRVFHPAGLYLARADGSQPRRLAGGPGEITFGVQWSADGKLLFFTRRPMPPPPTEREVRRASPFIQAVVLSPDGRRVATATAGAIRLWDADTGKELRAFDNDFGLGAVNLESLAFSPDGQLILGCSQVGALLWDARSGKQLRTDFRTATFSPDGRILAAASGDDLTGLICDARTGQVIRKLRGPANRVEKLTFSPDGKQLVTLNIDGTVQLWDVKSGKEVRVFRGQPRRVAPVQRGPAVPQGPRVASESTTPWPTFPAAVSPDGRHVLTAVADGTTLLWDAHSGAKIRSFRCRFIAQSADGKRVLGVIRDRPVTCDAESGKVLHTFPADVPFTFSHDGKLLFTETDVQETGRVFDSGQEIRVFDEFRSRAGYSADGKRRLTLGEERTTARLLDAASGQELRSFGKPAAAASAPAPSACAVYAIDLDGSNLRRITPAAEHVYLGGNFLFATQTLAR
jgi:WD40 repeat protein